jgi:hypothetical protein
MRIVGTFIITQNFKNPPQCAYCGSISKFLTTGMLILLMIGN